MDENKKARESNRNISTTQKQTKKFGMPTPVPTISVEFEDPTVNNGEDEMLQQALETKDLKPKPTVHVQSIQSRSQSIPMTFNTTERRRSLFQEVIQTSLSEGSRLNEIKAIELEDRLKKLATAFSTRIRKTKAEIKRPPTPSSDESESDMSTVSENNLLNRLEAFLPTPDHSRRPSIQAEAPNGGHGNDIERILRRRKSRNSQLDYYRHKLIRVLTFRYLFDPQSKTYISWLAFVSAWFIYNAWVLPLREAFQLQTMTNVKIWFIIDCLADFFYILDIILFKSHVRFVQDGFPIQTVKESWKIYSHTKDFAVDVCALLPFDILSSIFYVNMPWLRIPRLLKLTTFWELFERLDTTLASPVIARISKALLYMIYLIHLNASAYYAVSVWEGMGSTEWTFGYGNTGDGNAYIRCFYFATKTATSIGKNPRPSNELEYLFMTVSWLGGVFVFALLIGQIRDIIATATKAQNDYRLVCYTASNYLHRFEAPKHLQNKVNSWLNYTWKEQKTLDEGQIITQLPQKMQADLALHIHIETLSKVKLFQNCETAFLRDLVVKLRSVIFLPGDYICRKGEVGKEMYIIKSGRINVLGGASGHDILVTLTGGSVFGEISLLAIGGMTKRTADVRTAGYANLFVLNKTDLNAAIKDYPQAQESLKKKAKKLIRENIKKQKAQVQSQKEATKSVELQNEFQSQGTLSSSQEDGPRLEFDDDEKIIIKNPSEQPRLVQAVLNAIRPDSKVAKYLKYGSKMNSMDILPGQDEMISYPPSPYLPLSPRPLTQDLIKSYMSDSSEDDLNYMLPITTGRGITSLTKVDSSLDDDNDEDVFIFEGKGFGELSKDKSENNGGPSFIKSPSDAGTYREISKVSPATSETRNVQRRRSLTSTASSSSSSSGRGRFNLQRQFSADVATSSDGDDTKF